MYVCASHACPAPEEAREGIVSSGTRVRDCVSFSCGYRDLNLNTPQEQPMLFTTELSLQPCIMLFITNLSYIASLY